MRSLVGFLLFVFAATQTHAQSNTFKNFQEILNKHLTEKRLPNGGFESYFNYTTAKNNKETLKAISEQKKTLSQFSTDTLKSKSQANAFWINAYNFFMITKILDEGFKKGKLKIDGVKDLGGFFDKYSAFKDKDFQVGGKKLSLDGIEKGILLSNEYKKKDWKDARIHFAVNCASVGCPPLRKRIYTAMNINNLLDENSKKAFKTQRHLRLEGKTLWLTHLFKWYKKDFEEQSGSVKKFISSYIEDEKLKSNIQSASEIKYIDYDWQLNRKENF